MRELPFVYLCLVNMRKISSAISSGCPSLFMGMESFALLNVLSFSITPPIQPAITELIRIPYISVKILANVWTRFTLAAWDDA